MTTTNALITQASTVQSFTYNFNLTDLDNYTSFTNLFDQWRIDAVVFRVIPMQNALGLTTNSTTTLSRLYTVIDYDDATAIGLESTMRGNESCMLVPPGEGCSRTFRPRMALAAYQGAFTGYMNAQSTWIDSNTPAVQHYGLKLLVTAGQVGQTQLQSWTIERDYHVSFRKVHGS